MSLETLFDPAAASLSIEEVKLRKLIESFDFYAFTVGLAQLKAYFPTFRGLTGFDTFQAYIEDRFGIKPSNLKKCVDVGRTIINNKDVLQGIDLNKIRSRSHLNFLDRALTNHASWDVQAALVSIVPCVQGMGHDSRSQEDLEKSRKALQDHVRSISISTSKVEGEADAPSSSESSPSLAPPQADSMSA